MCFINTVLIRPFGSNDEVLLAGDVKLYLDTSFEKLKHLPVVGEVVAVPDQLYFSKNKSAYNSLEWKTTMELQVGDVVNYHYLDIEKCITQHDYVLCDGKIYYPIRYDRIFCAKRKLAAGDKTLKQEFQYIHQEDGHYQVIMLNGYVLASPVPENIITTMKLPDQVSDRYNAKYGVVRFLGSCNTTYTSPYPPDDNRIEVGSVLVLDKSCDIKLEYDMHTQFDGKAQYFRIQRRNIKAFFKQ